VGNNAKAWGTLMVLMDHYYRGVAYPKDSFARLQVFYQAVTRGRYSAVAAPAQTLVDAATYTQFQFGTVSLPMTLLMASMPRGNPPARAEKALCSPTVHPRRASRRRNS